MMIKNKLLFSSNKQSEAVNGQLAAYISAYILKLISADFDRFPKREYVIETFKMAMNIEQNQG